jgi:phage/plasmid-associated DNA primase
MENKKSLEAAPGPEKREKLSVVQVSALVLAEQMRVAKFRGRPMVEITTPYRHFVPLHKDRFEAMAYPILGGVSRSRISDVFAYMSNVAQDLSAADYLVNFGGQVWDMRRLKWVGPSQADNTVWRSPYGAPPPPQAAPSAPVFNPFIMSLAGGDEGVYGDIMQSLAPMIMDMKPDGVVWWVGDGANGKSTLMDAIYRIFPGQLSSITVKRLTDGRDTPSLNGTLANIVKESSEGRIEDTEIYKAVGTHENFRVHKFHSQDDIEIRGNMHHIFSGNAIPTFNDKGWSARRRTFIVPFAQRFASDPEFENKTFTKPMFESLIAEMCRYAVILRDQGLRYKWSAATLAAKAEYDTEANNAEEYAREIILQGVVAFESFHPVKQDYENWCMDQGYVPLGIHNLRRAMQSSGFERRTARLGDGLKKMYAISTVKPSELKEIGMSRPGLYTVPGFETPKEPEVPEFKEAATADEPPPKRRVDKTWV